MVAIFVMCWGLQLCPRGPTRVQGIADEGSDPRQVLCVNVGARGSGQGKGSLSQC